MTRHKVVVCDSCGAELECGPAVVGSGWMTVGADHGIGTEKVVTHYCPRCYEQTSSALRGKVDSMSNESARVWTLIVANIEAIGEKWMHRAVSEGDLRIICAEATHKQSGVE